MKNTPSPRPDPEQVRQLAYELWEAQGRPEGHSLEHWREAERRIAHDAAPAAARMPPVEAAIKARGEANGSRR
jgi:hypothetical protein